ncbi:MAG: RluA family pseudouridine synthase [Pseudomonadota bacterium]
MSGVEFVVVGDDEAEQRIDRWLRKRLSGVSQGLVEKLCRRGEVRVDGGRVKASTRIGPGQIVRIPPVRVDAKSAPSPSKPVPKSACASLVEDLCDAVIFMDDDLIALNKPPGLSVQGGTGQKQHIAGALDALRFEKTDPPRLVHRLDRDTSGVLLLARTGRAATALGRSFQRRDVEKTYFAAVAGVPNISAGTIRLGLRKVGGRNDEKMVSVHPDEVRKTEGAKPAVTQFAVVERAASRLSWVALRPITGRTHQLRVHMASIGCPIAGDGKYGGRGQENRGDGWGGGLGGSLSRKLHLHAAQLSFDHPIKTTHISISAQLPEHMQKTWNVLGWDVEAWNGGSIWAD